MTASCRRTFLHESIGLLGLSAVFLLAACVFTSGAVEREIRTQYKMLERAYAAQDLAAVMASRDASLQVIIPGTAGEVENYEQTAQLMRRWFAENKPPIDVRYIIESVEVHSSDEVAVRVLQRGSRYRESNGGLRHVKHEVRQRETWVRTASGWKVRRIDDIDLSNRKVWVNGRSIPLADQ
jgi:hypothetical protein